MRTLSVIMVAGLFAAGAAQAQTTLAEWTFEVSIPATAGPHTAEGGLFAAGSFASGFHADPGVVYSNPAGNGSAESFSSNFWSVNDYYQFQTSTLGYQAITVTWDQARSSTGPGTFDLEWSTDGINFNLLLNDFAVLQSGGTGAPGTWTSTPPANPIYTLGPIAGPAALDNQASIWFRMRAEVAGSSTAGTNRVDNVIVSGTLIPTPGTLALLGLAGFVASRRRR